MNNGVIFSVDVSGNNYSILHQFGTANVDGNDPAGSLAQSGPALYGMTGSGGTSGRGTVFKVGTDGTGFAVIHSFQNSVAHGSVPLGSLAVSGATLYGMTATGGSEDQGTVFSMGNDGSNFKLLHSFTGGTGGDTNDGARPDGDLNLVGSTLYGATPTGGADNYGTIFSISIDGSNYIQLYSFTGGPNDGKEPEGGLTYLNGQLYGTTHLGGANNDGVIFSIPVPEPSSLVLAAAGAAGILVRFRRRNSRKHS
jgi:uncharacterized repeat protein (TIGR03803 family)